MMPNLRQKYFKVQSSRIWGYWRTFKPTLNWIEAKNLRPFRRYILRIGTIRSHNKQQTQAAAAKLIQPIQTRQPSKINIKCKPSNIRQMGRLWRNKCPLKVLINLVFLCPKRMKLPKMIWFIWSVANCTPNTSSTIWGLFTCASKSTAWLPLTSQKHSNFWKYLNSFPFRLTREPKAQVSQK